MAIAASVVLAIFLFRLTSETTVSAAELLRDATAAETRKPEVRVKRLKVRTRKGVFIRPTRDVAASELAARFSSAGYDWNDPLSARAFASWRDTLAEKDDRVRLLYNSEFGSGRFYRVTTSTPAGDLAEASITIRAADLQAVHEAFRFRDNETVEITEEPEHTQQPSRLLPPELRATDANRGQQDQTITASRPVTAADEVQVLAALHSIGADLGEPVEVRRERSELVVVALAPSPDRQAQIRAALSTLPFVSLRFENPEPVASSQGEQRIAEAEAPRVNAFVDLLGTRLGSRNTVENFTNHVLDLSEAALARAHALRRLAERFPPETEAALPADAGEKLGAMRRAHSDKLMAGVRQLMEVIAPVAGRVTVPPAGFRRRRPAHPGRRPEHRGCTVRSTEVIFRAAALALALLGSAVALRAQVRAQISGFVHDSSGAVVRDAAIAVLNLDTGVRRAARSNGEGFFAVSSLTPGQYKITARKEGFQTVARTGIAIGSFDSSRIDFLLEPGSLHEEVTVTGTPSLSNTIDAGESWHTGRVPAELLPVNGRGLQALIDLAPGVLTTPATGGEAGQFSANGQRPATNYFTVDGVGANNGVSGSGLPGQFSGAALPAMTAIGSLHNLVALGELDEMRIGTSTYAPEFGRLPGAQIAVSTRSGSNDFHGELFGAFRHRALTANDPFARATGYASRGRLSDVGATAAGPLVRNRSFFHFSTEHIRLR
ncbi:MAG TPA: carboxypeptidase-like regulatory domain-containing protein, partial [Bryobacteraceae bacterium]|nr:carboxypeptidase-like regulatory domain-containing protein [Bryobacteraceae bacterium]